MYSLLVRLKAINDLAGRLIAWQLVPMVLGTFVVVVLRYAFDLGWIWMQEAVGWMHAATFMLAAAYTLNRDEHVRVDVFYSVMTPRRRAWVNLIGTLLFLLPMAIFLLVTSWDYVTVSWEIREASREVGGLPYPFLSVLKSVIPLTACLLIIQGVAEALEQVMILRGVAPPPAPGVADPDPGI